MLSTKRELLLLAEYEHGFQEHVNVLPGLYSSVLLLWVNQYNGCMGLQNRRTINVVHRSMLTRDSRRKTWAWAHATVHTLTAL